jgi:hypothetical protein
VTQSAQRAALARFSGRGMNEKRTGGHGSKPAPRLRAPTVLRFVPFSRSADYLRLGWMATDSLIGCHHGECQATAGTDQP